MRVSIPLSLLISSTMILGLASCGKPDEAGEAGRSGTETAVRGAARFASQCPQGTFSEPVPTKLTLWDCPLDFSPAEVITPPQDLIFQADCKEMTLTVRTADRRVDSTWEVMPDGTFSMTLDAGAVGFRSDSRTNRGACTTFTQGEIWGKLNCQDRDRVVIQVDSIWYLGKGKTPDGFTGRTCNFQPGCYLHAEASISQCF